MSESWAIGIIAAALLYLVWVKKFENKDYFIVEWRTLDPTGAELFSHWSGAHNLSRASLSARGLRLEDYRIMRGNDLIGSRAFTVWQSYEIANSQFETLSKIGPEPYNEGCLALLWAVRTTGEKQALARVKDSMPTLVKAGTAKRIAKD